MSVILPMTDGEEVVVKPGKIVCLGLNYLEHIKESQSVNVQNFTDEIPKEPVLFPKTPNVIVGSGDSMYCLHFYRIITLQICVLITRESWPWLSKIGVKILPRTK